MHPVFQKQNLTAPIATNHHQFDAECKQICPKQNLTAPQAPSQAPRLEFTGLDTANYIN